MGARLPRPLARPAGGARGLRGFDLAVCLDPELHTRDLGGGPRDLWAARLKILYRWKGLLKTPRPAPLV